MTRSLGRRSGAVVVLLTALLLVVPASPAGAEPVITIDQPRDGQTLESASVTFSGRVTSSGALYTVRQITLSVGDKTPFTKECNETPCSFSWKPSAFTLNGPYELKVRATEGTVVLAGTPAETTRAFRLAVPPAKPVLDPPKVNDQRNVELSWSRNTEPDMLYYAVFRKDPGGSKYEQVPGGTVTQPKSGSKVTFVDTSVSASDGGDYAYQVVAVRKGATGTDRSEAVSDPSASRSASLPPPPTTSTTAPAPGSPVPPAPGGTTTTARPGPPAGVDLSSFLRTRPQGAPLTPITVPEAPDTGFGSLPFGARPPGDDIEEGEAEAVLPNDVQRRSVIERLDNGRPLVPIAGGLILLLLAMHMRLLNRRVKAAGDADLPVDARVEAPAEAVTMAPEAEPAPAAAPPPAVTVVRAPAPDPEVDLAPEPELVVGSASPRPAPAVYDVVEDEAWETDWAPVADFEFDLEADFEPEPECAHEPDPEPVSRWAPPAQHEQAEQDEQEDQDEYDDPPEPDGVDEIEVFEVVSPRRRLARAGSR